MVQSTVQLRTQRAVSLLFYFADTRSCVTTVESIKVGTQSIASEKQPGKSRDATCCVRKNSNQKKVGTQPVASAKTASIDKKKS